MPSEEVFMIYPKVDVLYYIVSLPSTRNASAYLYGYAFWVPVISTVKQ